MKYYLLGSSDGYNGLRFPDVNEWQKYMGYNPNIMEQWSAPHLEYVYSRRSKKNFDISTICNPLFTMSCHAMDCLHELIIKYGVLLPIASPSNYAFFYCTNIVDALIPEESDIIYLDEKKNWISTINKFALSKKAVNGCDIFRVPQSGFRYTFFSERFREQVQKFDLKGVHFERIEPIALI